MNIPTINVYFFYSIQNNGPVVFAAFDINIIRWVYTSKHFIVLQILDMKLTMYIFTIKQKIKLALSHFLNTVTVCFDYFYN